MFVAKLDYGWVFYLRFLWHDRLEGRGELFPSWMHWDGFSVEFCSISIVSRIFKHDFVLPIAHRSLFPYCKRQLSLVRLVCCWWKARRQLTLMTPSSRGLKLQMSSFVSCPSPFSIPTSKPTSRCIIMFPLGFRSPFPQHHRTRLDLNTTTKTCSNNPPPHPSIHQATDLSISDSSITRHTYSRILTMD